MRCVAPDCDRLSRYSNGLCGMHRSRWKRHGSLEKRSGGRPTTITLDPIRKNIDELRLSRDWSIQRLHAEVGISNNFFYHHSDPSLETLRAVGACFNVDYWRLLIPGEFTKES